MTLSFAAPAYCADLGVGLELQGAVANAPAAMDGSGRLPAFDPGGSAAAPSDDAQPPEPPAKKGLLEKAKGAASAFRKFLVRNPVEASFAVSIPVTFFFGPTAGMISGAAVYWLLWSQRKNPF